MDEDSKSHMERRMNSYMQSREDQVFHRRTRFALDMDGNMIFDDDGYMRHQNEEIFHANCRVL